MDDFLAKPFRLGELATALARWLPIEAGNAPAAATTAAPAAATADPGLLEPARIEELRALGRRTGRDLLGNLAALFRQSGAEQLTELRQAFAKLDADAARRAAHTLKSSAGNIGAKEIAGLAQAIEEAARTFELESARPHLDRLLAQLPRVMDELEKVATSG